MALDEVCTVLDALEGKFTLKDIVERGAELDPPVPLDVKKIGAGVASLAHIGALKEMGYAPGSKAKQYEKDLGVGTSYVEANKQGQFKGLYSQYRGEAQPRASTLRKRAAQPEVEPEPVYEELDPEEFAKALGWEGFSRVWKWFVDEAMADADAMREQAERVSADARLVQGLKEQDDRAHQAKINELNNQLRDEREKVMNLQAEVARAHAGVRREAAPKILYQRGVQGGMQHGVTTGAPSREVRHGTGGAFTNHAPAAAIPKVKVEWKKK